MSCAALLGGGVTGAPCPNVHVMTAANSDAIVSGQTLSGRCGVCVCGGLAVVFDCAALDRFGKPQ